MIPQHDHPRDKANSTSGSPSRGQEALSNGVLVSQRPPAHADLALAEHKPMTTYLAFFVTGQSTSPVAPPTGLPGIKAVA